jgi:hypothetical protein
MPRLTKLALVLTTFMLLSFAAPAVSATTLIIGSSNDLSRYPFGPTGLKSVQASSVAQSFKKEVTSLIASTL